ncbi:MAG: hypothetical protein RJA22_2056 [Verrucomicrobiota bacterium]
MPKPRPPSYGATGMEAEISLGNHGRIPNAEALNLSPARARTDRGHGQLIVFSRGPMSRHRLFPSLPLILGAAAWPLFPVTAQTTTAPPVRVVPRLPASVLSNTASGATRPQPNPPAVTAPADARPASAPAVNPFTAATALNPADRQLQELLRLTFDRRPASILKAHARKATGDGAFTNALERFQADVVTGDWPAVGRFLAALPEAQRGTAYRGVLAALLRVPPSTTLSTPNPETGEPGMAGSSPSSRAIEPLLLPEDVLGLADARPGSLEEADLESLGRVLARALARGGAIEPFLARLEAGTAQLGGTDQARRRRAAQLLVAAGRLADSARFLPSPDEGAARKDYAGLDLRARVLLAEGTERNDAAALRGAWDVNQSLLADRDLPAAQREAGLQRAVELLPLLGRQRGQDWLRESFRRDPAQGMAILAAVGAAVGQGAAESDLEKRRRNLDLQRRVVDELLGAAGTNVAAWRPALTLLAAGWIAEADRARQRHRPRTLNQQIIDFDAFGNPIYSSFDPGMNTAAGSAGGQALALEVLLPGAPGEAWLDACEPSVQLRTRALLADIHLKLEQEEKALPWIESLAPAQPKAALALANDLLRSWATTKDPNRDSRRNLRIYTSPYGNSYSQGIPITRTLQVRNLQQLAAILARLRALGPLDDRAMVNAFAASHSQAEVFRVSDITDVLGPPETLAVSTLSELLQAMRERLAKQWRAPAVQQQAKTKRTDRDIQAEVNRGYELVLDLTARAVAQRPQEWRLWTVRGATFFDWAEYEYGKDVALAAYTEKRDQAFTMLAKGASLYADRAGRLDEREQTPAAFQQWFNATLGASDLAFLTRAQSIDTNRIDQIRAALLALPADIVERHVALLGKALVDAITALPPELKPRYLKAGLRLVGDHESAEPARRLVAYYDGLLQEVEFRARVDGDATVGHGRPFGLHLVIRHSDAVGRESGGFAKYLQNQQSMQYYYNPYGGQPVNYRDDLEKKIRETLNDRFEITSITWHDDKVEPRGYGRPEWRETPLAYLLLQARDAATDRIPPLQLDLDFLDRRGKVVLPVESQTVLLDARPERPPARPLAKLRLTQILDDREAASGRLSLEIKASAHGVVPPLDEVVDLALPGFRIEKTTDHGIAVTKLDTEGDAITPVCERNWLLSLAPIPATAGPASQLPTSFTFPKPRLPTEESALKHYQDADLATAQPTVVLSGRLARARSPLVTWMLSAVLFTVCAAGLWLLLRPRRATGPAPIPRHPLPTHCTPFTVLSLLRAIQQDAQLALPADRRDELASVIRDLENRYFAPTPKTAHDPDLQRLAQDWSRRVHELAGERVRA